MVQLPSIDSVLMWIYWATNALLLHRVLNDRDDVSHKGTKDTKELMAVETPLCTLCLCARKNWKQI